MTQPLIQAPRPSTPPPSALPRPLDLRVPSNRVAVIGAVAFGLAGLLLRRTWRQALGAGGLGLLGWSTARELDPDEPGTATLALALAGVCGLAQSAAGASPAVLPGLSALNATRVLSGTVGAAVTPLDTLALGAQSALTALTGHPLAALMPAAALALSAGEQDRQSPQAPWSVPAVLAAGALPPRHREPAAGHLLSDLLSLAALGLSAQFTVAEQPRSRADQAPLTLSASRLQASRLLTQGTLALGLLRRESGGLAPLAAASLATGLRRTWPALAGALPPSDVKNA